MTSDSPPKCDIHVHSTWSDGLLDIEELVYRAGLLNLEVLAITDHFPAMGYHHALQDNPLQDYFAEIQENKQGAMEKGTRLLSGLEFSVLGDIRDVPLQILDLLLVEGLNGNPESFFSQFFPIARQIKKARGLDFPLVIAPTLSLVPQPPPILKVISRDWKRFA